MRTLGRVLLALLAGLLSAGRPAALGQGERELRVLFVGNSYVYYHDMPFLLERLAEGAGRELHAEMIVEGGATLAQHWEGERARAAIRDGRWDFVVLQSQSTLGETFLVDGLERIAGSEDERGAMRSFAEAIRAVGARPLLAAHWKRRDAPERDGAALAAIFAEAARELDAPVAPLGYAWDAAHAALPELALYDDDGSHPSPAGSYLEACTFLATLLGRLPSAELPARIVGPPADDEGAVDLAREAVLVDLQPAVARELAAAAERARERWEGAVRAGIPAAPPIELPTVPKGEALDADALLGVWEGELRLYPRWLAFPATLSIELDRPQDAMVANVTVGFGGRPADVRFTATVTLDGDELAFVDPHGPNGTTVAYRASARGDVLSGIAAFEGAPALRGIGSWHATRRP